MLQNNNNINNVSARIAARSGCAQRFAVAPTATATTTATPSSTTTCRCCCCCRRCCCGEVEHVPQRAALLAGQP
jgi:hypothetical protein